MTAATTPMPPMPSWQDPSTSFAPGVGLPGGVTIKFEFIRPDRAAGLLEKNANPRKLRPSRVDQYGEDMATGRWQPYTSSIQIDGDGMLRDGQHRCAAAVKYEVGFWTLVLYGVSEETVDTTDQGLKRTVGDVLRAHGEANHLGLAAAISTCWRWDRRQMFSSVSPTVTEAKEYLAEHPSLRSAVSAASALSAPPLGARISAAAALIFRIRRIEAESAQDFIYRLSHGTGLEQDDPIWRYRNWLLSKPVSAYGRPTREMELALAVKAWNAHIQNKKVKALRWARGGTSLNEEFPELVGPDGKPWPFPDVLLAREIRRARSASDE